MQPNLKAAQNQLEKDQARERIISLTCQEYWNSFVTDPRFDEFQLVLQTILEDQEAYVSDTVHVYAHNQGLNQGWRKCLETIRLGCPEDKKATPASSQSIYRAFAAPKPKE